MGSALLKCQGTGCWRGLGSACCDQGGIELTHRMLDALDIGPTDEVVELAAGLGVTMKLALSHRPASYTAIEQEESAAEIFSRCLTGPAERCLVRDAKNTGLPETSATVVYGEAMLTMQAYDVKRQIVREAYRLLKPLGRYAIHEMCLVPDDLEDSIKKEIQKTLSQTLHVGARPLTSPEWRALLESEGFAVQTEITTPMRLLESGRLIRDDGLFGAFRFACNVLRNSEARERVAAMCAVFRRYCTHFTAVVLVGVKLYEHTDSEIDEVRIGRDDSSRHAKLTAGE